MNNDLAPGEARFEEPELDAGLAKPGKPTEAYRAYRLSKRAEEGFFNQGPRMAGVRNEQK